METVLNCLLPLSEERRAAFAALLPDACWRWRERTEVTAEDLSGVTVVLGSPDAALIEHAQDLRWLHSVWAGGDEYLAPGVLPEEAMLTTSVGAYGHAVAEHMLSLTLACCKRLGEYRDKQKEALWDRAEDEVKGLRDALVLILGTGDIGSHYALMCSALGSRTVGLRRDPSRSAPGVGEMHALSELETWLPRADVVALALPHTADTVHILNEKRLRLMKDDAILINCGRGSAVDTAALCRVMDGGKLFGAGLDVTETEPLPPEDPLWRQSRVLITPHAAGGFRLAGTFDRAVDLALDNLRRYASGQELRNRLK